MYTVTASTGYIARTLRAGMVLLSGLPYYRAIGVLLSYRTGGEPSCGSQMMQVQKTEFQATKS